MPITDRFGLPLTTISDEAADYYIEAVDGLLSANARADEWLEQALAIDPDFALARAALARFYQLDARPGAAAAEIAAARALVPSLSPRERGHIAVIGLAVEGAAASALTQMQRQIAEYPRDALPLSLALGVYGLIGFSGRRDHHEAQRTLLEGLAGAWGEDWWFLGYLGWARIETGALKSGIPLVEHALALNPRNAHAAHARAHGYHEAGDAKGGADFLAAWRPGYDRMGQLHGHLSWHLALFELACGRPEQAAAIYRDSLRPAVVQGAPLPSLADAASFLWRWRLYGVAPSFDQEWAEVAAHARQHFPRAGLAFADVHAALAAAATGDGEGLATRIKALDRLAGAGRLPAGRVVPALCAAVGALAGDAPDAAIAILERALPDLPRIGGSHAQRELFEDTLIAAYFAAGRTAALMPLLTARLARRPSARDEAALALCWRSG
jgi:tetratricopeptide (TPR) repeat protein